MRSCCRRPCRCGVDSIAVPGVSPSCPAAGVRAARKACSALCSLVVPAATGGRDPVIQHSQCQQMLVSRHKQPILKTHLTCEVHMGPSSRAYVVSYLSCLAV